MLYFVTKKDKISTAYSKTVVMFIYLPANVYFTSKLLVKFIQLL